MTYIIDEALLLKDLSEADSLDSAIQASDDIVEIYLQHFGVKGMKWGVRKKDERSERERGGAERPSRREQRARIFDAKADKLGITIKELEAEISAMPQESQYRYKRLTAAAQISDARIQQSRWKDDAAGIRKSGLSSTQKKLLIGAVAVAAFAATSYYVKAVDSGQLDSLRRRGEAFLKGEKYSFKKNDLFASKTFSPEETLAKVVKGINPNYASARGSMNCRRCSLAYELRRRGNDVVATTTLAGTGQSETGLINALTPGKWSRNASSSLRKKVRQDLKNLRGQALLDIRKNPANIFDVADANDPASILKALAGQPVGARGEIAFNFGSFGHSMSYEIFKDRPVIFDTQKGQMHEITLGGLGAMNQKWGGHLSNAAITRLDNVPLDMTFLTRWATDS